MKLWQGRFDAPTAQNADLYNDSLPFDCKLWKEDITASIAHATMLGECGIIAQADAKTIVKGLQSIYEDIEKGVITDFSGAEDIHSFVENLLVSRIGDAGKRLHTARSRNDQVATDFRLYARGAFTRLQTALIALCQSLIEKADECKNYTLPGYTHLRKAQPMCAGHFFAAYAEMFLRDIDRVIASRKRANVMPLGSGALAGTSYPINRTRTCELLGFDKPCDNSLDGVSDRDFAAEFAFDCSLVMSHLSRLCEDIILYSGSEFGYLEISDAYSTGSSIMPQKKNPDVCELMRGKTGRIYGYLTAILTVLKGIPLAYDKDLQEDKEGFFDCEQHTVASCNVMAEMLRHITLKGDNANAASTGDFCCATDVADYLTKKGVPFRTAHAVTGAIVRWCIQSDKTLQNMTVAEYKTFDANFESDILQTVSAQACADARTSFGGASRSSVETNIASLKKRMNDVK